MADGAGSPPSPGNSQSPIDWLVRRWARASGPAP